MNVTQFVFFNERSTGDISNAFGNVGFGSSLTLQIAPITQGTEINVDLTVEGATDLAAPNTYFPLKVVSLETFKTSETITKAGIYMVIIEGISKIRIKSNNAAAVGTFKAYATSNM